MPSTYNDYLDYIRPHLTYCNEIFRTNILRFSPEDKSWYFEPWDSNLAQVKPSLLPAVRQWIRFYRSLSNQRIAYILIEEMRIASRFFSQGVHIIECSNKLRESMEQVDLPITSEFYHKPFPAVGIQFSDAFCICSWEGQYKRLALSWLNDACGGETFYVTVMEGETFDDALWWVEEMSQQMEQQYQRMKQRQTVKD